MIKGTDKRHENLWNQTRFIIVDGKGSLKNKAFSIVITPDIKLFVKY
ncbi:isocitrate dehydrogenase [Bacillus sp. SG-1]|nr:isocitrate dehydrogenase [Bacillus sp. SG-1]